MLADSTLPKDCSNQSFGASKWMEFTGLYTRQFSNAQSTVGERSIGEQN